MLRAALILAGLGGVVVSVILLSYGLWIAFALYAGFWGLGLTAAMLVERHHYRPKVDRSREGWRRTGERFTDPATRRLVEVLYNPFTGERDYVEVDSADPRVGDAP